MLGIILGVFTVLLGLKAFTPKGLPLTKTKNLTGTGAKVIGVVCVLLGAFFLFDGVMAAVNVVNRVGGTAR